MLLTANEAFHDAFSYNYPSVKAVKKKKPNNRMKISSIPKVCINVRTRFGRQFSGLVNESPAKIQIPEPYF